MGLKDIIGGIGSFISGSATSLITAVGNAIDQISTTDEEKLKLKNDIQEKVSQFVLGVLDHQAKEQEELTKRLQSDMTSDSWLSKNIRPMTLIFILGLLGLIVALNIYQIKIDPSYTEILKIWGALVFSFYFGSRWNEKITRIKNQS